MNNASLWIRHAKEADVRNIYRLQFNEGWLLSSNEVARKIQQMYVMGNENRLIGVHLAAKNQSPLLAPAVHPLFPQKTVEEMLLRGVHLLETGGQ